MLRIISKIVPTPHGKTNGRRSLAALGNVGIWVAIAQLATLV